MSSANSKTLNLFLQLKQSGSVHSGKRCRESKPARWEVYWGPFWNEKGSLHGCFRLAIRKRVPEAVRNTATIVLRYAQTNQKLPFLLKVYD